MSRNIELAYDKKSTQTIENRAQIVQGLQQSAAERMFESPTDKVAYDEAKQSTQKFADFLMNEDKAIKALLAVENTDQNLAHHGVSVASIAVEIAKISGYKDTRNIPNIALGGLIHDVGHYMSGQNVGRPLKDFTPDELKIYYTHPSEGAKKLKDLKHMELTISQIVNEHEECINGSGFPEKAKENKLNPLSVFVQTANLFDRLVTFEKMTKAEAVKKLTLDYLGRYPLPHINALKTMVQNNA
jgi:HD-GYP domain-containing protein (c-di-GMP phosphodiesterase class II)